MNVARCPLLPVPGCAIFAVVPFIHATSSGSVLAASDLRPASTSGLLLSMEIGAKSFSLSNGSDL